MRAARTGDGVDLGVFIEGQIQPQLQAHTASLGILPRFPLPPRLWAWAGPRLGTQDRTPGRRQEAPWGGRMEKQGGECMGVARDGVRGCADGPRHPASQGHGLRGIRLQARPLQLVPPVDQQGMALLRGILSAPPAASPRSSQLSSGPLPGPLPGLPPPF